MVVASHTFFEVISAADTPENLRETYQSALLVNKLAGISDPLFDDYSLFYQIFIHAVIRDIKYGGLGEGFAEVIARVQEEVSRHYHAVQQTKRRRKLNDRNMNDSKERMKQ